VGPLTSGLLFRKKNSLGRMSVGTLQAAHDDVVDGDEPAETMKISHVNPLQTLCGIGKLQVVYSLQANRSKPSLSSDMFTLHQTSSCVFFSHCYSFYDQ